MIFGLACQITICCRRISPNEKDEWNKYQDFLDEVKQEIEKL